MKGYVSYTEVTKAILDSLQVGDLVKVSDWKKPMEIKGVSENYAVMVQKNFGDTYYSVIEKKPRTAGQHNAMRQGFFHCGKDDYIFGATEFKYRFDDVEAVTSYLAEFEKGETHLSERTAITISQLQVKHRTVKK
ncbi:hypothetical protein [Pelosinus sp. UFO1]|uniref:hypothetical protein n=1 Tax=Pelosinus sp. UFO1 TaxID=484770 RepID=UPI0004D1A85D|nr:hypothetical protein [Pelosinus sp. UFO1]AIF52035.1 hypothetical protein UFO1_2488 [Pelosinus sp. UFO1]